MTDAKPVQKKQPLRILILWNHHEEASQPSEEAGPAQPTAESTTAEPTAAEPAAEKDAAAEPAAEKDAAAETAAEEDAAAEGAAQPGPAQPGAPGPATETVERNGRAPRQVDEIASVLRQHGYRVFVFDLEDDPTRIVDAITVVRPSLIFNLVDSFYGDTTQHATVAAYFDLLGIPYTGSDPLCLATSQDRVRVHLLLDNAGIPVPRFEVIRDVNVIPDTEDFRFPLIVTQAFDDLYEEEGEERPIDDRDELVASSAALFKEFDLPYLVEEYIGYRRLHAIVLGNRVLEVLPLVELSATEEAGAPWALAQLDYDTADRVRQLARRAFRVMGCRDMAQIDFHLDEEDVPYVVDVRPMFEMGPGSVFWGAAEHTARGHAEVLAELVRITCKRANLDQPTGQEPAEPHLPDIQLPDAPAPEPEPAPAPSEPAEAAAEAAEEPPAAEQGEEDEELEAEEGEAGEEGDEELEAEDAEEGEEGEEEDEALEAEEYEEDEELEAEEDEEDEEPAVSAESTDRSE